MKGFALGLPLKQRRKATQKSAITSLPNVVYPLERKYFIKQISGGGGGEGGRDKDVTYRPCSVRIEEMLCPPTLGIHFFIQTLQIFLEILKVLLINLVYWVVQRWLPGLVAQ